MATKKMPTKFGGTQLHIPTNHLFFAAVSMQSRYVIDVMYMTIIGRYDKFNMYRYLIVVKLDRWIDRIQKDRCKYIE